MYLFKRKVNKNIFSCPEYKITSKKPTFYPFLFLFSITLPFIFYSNSVQKFNCNTKKNINKIFKQKCKQTRSWTHIFHTNLLYCHSLFLYKYVYNIINVYVLYIKSRWIMDVKNVDIYLFRNELHLKRMFIISDSISYIIHNMFVFFVG